MYSYLVTSSLMFAVLSVIWTKEGWVNLLFKLGFAGLAVFGGFNLLSVAGFVVRI